jgi:hypothetical protein
VEKGPALVEVRLVSGVRLGDLALEAAGHGREHPRPCVIGVGVGVCGDPQGPPQDLWQGGDEALEGPGSEEVVLLSVLGSGAALSIEGAALASAGAAGVEEGASGALAVLAIEGAADAAPVVSGVPPALGGSVVSGAVVAPAVDGAYADARFSSSPAACGSVAGVVVDAGSGPGVVWLVFLFFLFFFSSFFSSASLGRRRVKKLGKR